MTIGQQIIEPLGPINAIVSDYTTWKDADGHVLNYPRSVAYFRANAAITKYNCVEFVAPATGTPLSVKTFANADLGHYFVGVAIDAATAAGQIIRVVTAGFTLVNVTGTPAATNLAVKSGTDGAAAASGTVDATLVVGTVIGTFLGAKDGNNQAPLWVRHS